MFFRQNSRSYFIFLFNIDHFRIFRAIADPLFRRAHHWPRSLKPRQLWESYQIRDVQLFSNPIAGNQRTDDLPSFLVHGECDVMSLQKADTAHDVVDTLEHVMVSSAMTASRPRDAPRRRGRNGFYGIAHSKVEWRRNMGHAFTWGDSFHQGGD